MQKKKKRKVEQYVSNTKLFRNCLDHNGSFKLLQYQYSGYRHMEITINFVIRLSGTVCNYTNTLFNFLKVNTDTIIHDALLNLKVQKSTKMVIMFGSLDELATFINLQVKEKYKLEFILILFVVNKN